MKLDNHIHYAYPGNVDDLCEILDKTQTDKATLVALYDKERGSETIDCLHAKYVINRRFKDKIYVFGSNSLVPYHKFKRDKNYDLGKAMVEHVKDLRACGCDGIKMLEGKPSNRKRYPIPNFDIEEMDSYWAYLEKEKINVVWHVNDPEEFWDEAKVPLWAKNSGWFYGDGTYVNNEDQYDQIKHVLERHPLLHITFAHAFFMSNQLDRLSRWFEAYPNINIDLTPGIEMYTNWSDHIDRAKAFFKTYQDRILYGTDIELYQPLVQDPHILKDAFDRAELVPSFLKNRVTYLKGDSENLLSKVDLTIASLELDDIIVDKIMGGNALRINGKVKEVNVKALKEEIIKEKEAINYLAEYYNLTPYYKNIDYFEDYFNNI